MTHHSHHRDQYTKIPDVDEEEPHCETESSESSCGCWKNARWSRTVHWTLRTALVFLALNLLMDLLLKMNKANHRHHHRYVPPPPPPSEPVVLPPEYERCITVDWEQACSSIQGVAADRRLKLTKSTTGRTPNMVPKTVEDMLLYSQDPTVGFDFNCLRVYRLSLLDDQLTFPYYANHLLETGGDETMALLVHHGALRDAENYYCTLRRLVLELGHANVLVIAPSFRYATDEGVMSSDAVWNTTKPWGDWRVGAESDPTHPGPANTISSFAVLDQMIDILTDDQLYPNLRKVVFAGHSAGAQMVQRYALTSQTAASYDAHDSRVQVKFVIANPSSYTYLDHRRYPYNCGQCNCNDVECTCNQDCTEQTSDLQDPHAWGLAGTEWACSEHDYNDWPYGTETLQSPDGLYSVPYVMQVDMQQSIRDYKDRSVVYLVGHNDTCNDGLPTCDESCWKRGMNFIPGLEWPCFRNHMDTRCPAMMQGPNRRTRGHLYVQHLETYYGQSPVHALHEVPEVGHDAAAMLTSPMGRLQLFEW